MSMSVKEGHQTPYNPEMWDQYDTHPGHPEPETVFELHERVSRNVGSLAMDDDIFPCYGGSATNLLPAEINGRAPTVKINSNHQETQDHVGCGSSATMIASVQHGDGPQIFRKWRQ